MILEFSCANHKSIKEKIVFSTIASSDTTYEETLKDFSKYRVLRSAVIYGPNGSGKSNFLSALEFVRNLVCNSINYQPGQGIFQAPHKLCDLKTPSEYAIQFVKDDIRYAYGFSIVENLVKEEYLYYFPKGKQVKIFERDENGVKAGDRYKGVFDLGMSILKENRLFLSCAANFSNIEEVERAFLFFQNDIVVYNPHVNNWIEYSIQLMQKDEEVRQMFLDFLGELNTGIKDINVKLEKIQVKPSDLPIDMPEPLKNVLTMQEANRIDAKIVYDKFQTDLMVEESVGIKKLFEVICPIIDIIKNGKILICDEFEMGLHESIVHYIIQTFHKANQDKFAQLIFTTHDTSLLDKDIFRRDQVWFTELNEERATELYSLVEIKNVRKTENLERGYVSGKYGAIPMLNHSFSTLFTK
jgi:AAA15 family ATPase/GTPase